MGFISAFKGLKGFQKVGYSLIINTVYLPRRNELAEIYLSGNLIDGPKMDCPRAG